MSTAVVLLAAGASSRLGEPKALAEIGGVRVLARMLGAIEDGLGPSLDPSLDPSLGPPPARTLVVTGAHHAPIAAFLAKLEKPPEVAFHPDWSLGRTTSVQVAARLRPGQDMLLWPADVPLVSPGVLRSIVAEWDRIGRPADGWLAPTTGEAAMAPGSAIRPGFGHPILLGAGLAHRALDLEPDAPLRDLRRAAAPLVAVQVTDDSILDDLDTPEDLARLRSRMR